MIALCTIIVKCPCFPIRIFELHLIESVCLCALRPTIHWLMWNLYWILYFFLWNESNKKNWNHHYAFRFKSFIIENPNRQSEINVILLYIHSFIHFLFSILFCSFRNRRTSLYEFIPFSTQLQLKNFIFLQKFSLSFWFPFTIITTHHELPIR